MYNDYIVKNGDNLENISKRFGISQEELININNIKPIYPIMEGTRIKVPSNITTLFDYYTIKKGDNIYSIASSYNVSPKNLILLNNLDPNKYLYPNQKIMVPRRGTKLYSTKVGDSFQKIKQENNLKSQDLTKYNELYLMPDQLIVYKSI